MGFNTDYERITDEFFDFMTPITSQLPYMVCPGNHDVSCHSATDVGCDPKQMNYTTYNSRFRMPFRESSAVNNMWYSFDHGLVHYISISSETDFPGAPAVPGNLIMPKAGPFGDQLGWLKADLAEANKHRDTQPWVVVYAHRPMYTSNHADIPAKTPENLQKAFEELFHTYDVDIYLTGHVHAYERSWPIYNNEVMQKNYSRPGSTVHLVNGAAGNVENHSSDMKTPPPDFTAFRDLTHFGYSRLEVFNSSVLRWSFIDAETDVIQDVITIDKKPPTHATLTTLTQSSEYKITARTYVPPLMTK